MVRHIPFLVSAFLLVIVGCVDRTPEEVLPEISLPVVRGSQLQTFVKDSSVPVLVEFGVDFQCERCITMQRGVAELGQKYEGRANVVRVDFNMNTELVSQLGGTLCPTYVFFENGQPVRTLSFPVSTDMLESELAAMAGSPSEQSL